MERYIHLEEGKGQRRRPRLCTLVETPQFFVAHFFDSRLFLVLLFQCMKNITMLKLVK